MFPPLIKGSDLFTDLINLWHSSVQVMFSFFHLTTLVYVHSVIFYISQIAFQKSTGKQLCVVLEWFIHSGSVLDVFHDNLNSYWNETMWDV